MGIVAEATQPTSATTTPHELSGAISHDMAHDLLGLLTVIRGYAEMLAVEPNPTVQKEYCRIILRSCSKMTRFVGDARDGWVLHREFVQLAPFLRDCLIAQAAKAGSKGIQLHIDVPEAPAVHMDPACIERVLDNLLDNAIKYSPRGATITLAARVTSQKVVAGA